MTVLSAGLLLFRPGAAGEVEVLLGHMGGPYWARKDDAAWSVPKGEHDPGEDAQAAAEREFTEELGSPPPPGPVLELGTVRQRTGKLITVFAREGDFDADHITPGVFELEWPPRSGTVREFPEIDRAAWFDTGTARRKLVTAQVEFVDRLLGALSRAPGTAPS
ncbi:NUDIX domain-containing protein [Pseudonocardia xinjiangensis]|uniref:NUDIX domain-containing protein n=1 Tax=Pseudonocardia xinjiangensis TaxID=75289 RepID=UPI003D8E0CF9